MAHHAATSDAVALKLHVGTTGNVWYVDGELPPVDSRVSVDEFIASSVCVRADAIRVLGSPVNTELLVRLFELQDKQDFIFELASPLACPLEVDRCNPEHALYYMRQFEYPPSLGGWHEASAEERVSYDLLQELNHDPLNVAITERARDLFDSHVASHALKFIRTIDTDAACRLLAIIVDPRWYIDFNYPDRASKLESFLGLLPDVASRVLQESLPVADTKPTRRSNRHRQRCRIVMATWQWQDERLVNIRMENNGESTESSLGKLPGDFLWRIWDRHGRGVQGVLRACSTLVVYLRATWLNRLYQYSRQGDPIFCPEYFFRTEEEIEAYRIHSAKIDS